MNFFLEILRNKCIVISEIISREIKMRLTMKDVAAKAGVSAATVSRVVNGNENVSPEKREKVMKILSASLGCGVIGKKKRAPVKYVGFLMLPGSGSDMRSISKKILTVAECLPRKFALIIFPRNITPTELESKFLRGTLSGLLLSGHYIGDQRLLLNALDKIPHVWLNSYQIFQNEPVVLMGNEYAGKLAANYLADLHCRRPAVLRLKNANPGLSARIAGFQANCFLKKLPFCEISLILPERKPDAESLLPNSADIEKSIENAFEKNAKNPFPDGFFSPEEELTPFLYRYFLKKRIKKIPPVISCNHIPEYLAGLYPRPASIDLHPETLARLAIDELMLRINGGQPRPDNVAVVIQPQLVPGEFSVAPDLAYRPQKK
jgi:DNA-binding LacI/PurR family transcriptional regulator